MTFWPPIRVVDLSYNNQWISSSWFFFSGGGQGGFGIKRLIIFPLNISKHVPIVRASFFFFCYFRRVRFYIFFFFNGEQSIESTDSFFSHSRLLRLNDNIQIVRSGVES